MASQQDVQRYILASVALDAAKDEVFKAQEELRAADGMIGATVWTIVRARVEVLQPNKRPWLDKLDLDYHFGVDGGNIFVRLRNEFKHLVIEDHFPAEWLCDPTAVETWVREQRRLVKEQRRQELLQELKLLDDPK